MSPLTTDTLAQPSPPKASPISDLKIEQVPESGTEQIQATTPPYTTFTRNDKRLLTLLLGFATITSPLTATIYFPLLPLLRNHFHTSAQAINITLTIYIIFQAISPAIFGPLSDSLGRRPVYLLTLALYVIGNLGLAVNKHSYIVLLILRAIQSLGASAAFAVSYGVVADVCIPSERGSMLGPVSMALNLGACVGPVVGGWVGYSSGSYEWVFWALVIIGAILLLSVGAFLPETARSVVGDGSRKKQRSGWEESGYNMFRHWVRRRKENASGNDENEKQTVNEDVTLDRSLLQRFRIPNPWACLRMIFHFDTFFVLWMHSSFYTVDYSLVAAVPDIYKSIYHFNELQIGLAYLPRGAGIISGGYFVGKVMDHNYKFTAKKIGWTVNKVSGDDLNTFPIERARSRGSLWLLMVSTSTLIGYGWAVSSHVQVSVPLILQFIQGFWGTYFYTTYNTLLVDVFPESPSTAAAAASITRCAMAAAGVAVLQPLLDAAGRGWYFTLLGLWSGACGAVAVWLIRRKGMQCRTKRTNLGE
ncbi:uncharacterized protein KY384_009177 [Bacidia gigantensis]|uniref:uncharacterized protein n=1 Tax=Bacidia gigantensis TaxID=2732470 RepID=UPI001D04A5EF|nr:uncharacterized protein KY384_009177 [Bacidia gigantensis]KAG8525533.1 hypothetical protein KY384_009177 [Bacidia gigantensis]